MKIEISISLTCSVILKKKTITKTAKVRVTERCLSAKRRRLPFQCMFPVFGKNTFSDPIFYCLRGKQAKQNLEQISSIDFVRANSVAPIRNPGQQGFTSVRSSNTWLISISDYYDHSLANFFTWSATGIPRN